MSKIKEQTQKVLPVYMRENKPRIHAIPIIHQRPDGLPDGVHCGAWLDVDTNKVWKLLYGRPYANAEVIVRTDEDKFLAKFANTPYFPKNWEVLPANHLWWLVRPKVEVLAVEDYASLPTEIVLSIEQTILEVNKQSWAINDYITLAFDHSISEYMILDLSTAGQDSQADDYFRIEQFLKLCKREHILTLRNNARTVLHNLRYGTLLFDKHGQELERDAALTYKHIYASFNRPISAIWASIPDAIYMHEEHPYWGDGKMTPWTWVITKEPLNEEKIYSYELRWGWSSK